MWTITAWGAVTDSTSFLPPPLHSCSLPTRFLLQMSHSLMDCVMELQYLFNQTIMSKQIYVLIKETSFDCLLLLQGGEEMCAVLQQLQHGQRRHDTEWNFSFCHHLFSFQYKFLFHITFTFSYPPFSSEAENLSGPTSCMRL